MTSEEEFPFEAYDRQDFAPEVVSPLVMQRALIWDLAPHSMYEAIVERLGMVPTTDEAVEQEHEDAHARQSLMIPFFPVVLGLSKQAAEVAQAAMIEVHATEDPELAEEIKRDLNPDKFGLLAGQIALSVIGELAALGLIHTHPERIVYRAE